MDATVIEAKTRETGSKAARKIRKNDHVPCILYGQDTDPVPFQVPIRAVNKLVYGHTTPVVEIQVDGQSWKTILKDFDLHPITDRPQHADFQVLKEGRRVTLTVPLRYTGIPLGQKNGGDTQYIVRQMTVSVLPENIPSEIEIDVTDLEIGDSIHVYDLEKEYEIKMAPEQTLVTVVAPTIEAAPSPAGEEEEELEEGEEVPEGEEAPEGEEGEAVEGEDAAEGEGAEGGDEEYEI
jgi:large subunit ribosomal protein L25